jgi:organic hydroperoxide reductase OsmC/OhrA
MADVHAYRATCSWSGSTGQGYERYSRAHRLAAPPAEAQIAASADPHFGGDPARLNPEQLLVMAAASCQMLSFLAICARARIDVRAYEDDAEGVMPEEDPPMRITEIVLRPRIAVAGDVAEERLRRYTELAHHECFIARSLRTEIRLEPRFEAA